MRDIKRELVPAFGWLLKAVACSLAIVIAAPFQVGAQTTRPAAWSLERAPTCTVYSPCSSDTDPKAVCMAAIAQEVPQFSCVKFTGLTNKAYWDTGYDAGCQATANYTADGSCWWYTSSFTYGLAERVFPWCEVWPSATATVEIPQRLGPYDYVCRAKDFRIDIYGTSSTKALIAGPALPQRAVVTLNGTPVSGKSVSISISGGGSIGGATDGSGQFNFTYVPPYKKAIDHLTGTCSGCSNTTQKSITVDACDVCEKAVGNPIQPATGEKDQAEPDWQDAGTHALSFTRHYRSFDNLDAGLGPRWSHSYAASAFKTDLEGVVRFGDGNKVLFSRDSLVSAWVADNRKDGLIESPTGLTYVRASDESRWQFDAAGKAVSITQRNGWTMSLAYNESRLASVTNAFGRALQFGYDASGRLAAITPPMTARSPMVTTHRRAWPLPHTRTAPRVPTRTKTSAGRRP